MVHIPYVLIATGNYMCVPCNGSRVRFWLYIESVVKVKYLELWKYAVQFVRADMPAIFFTVDSCRHARCCR